MSHRFKHCVSPTDFCDFIRKYYTYRVPYFSGKVRYYVRWRSYDNFHKRRINQRINIKHILNFTIDYHFKWVEISYRSWHHGSIFTAYVYL